MRLAIALVAFLLFASPASATNVLVVDGDTIRIDSTTYRIWGIDAPEVGQSCRTANGKSWPCGRRAIAELEAAVVEGTPTCERRGVDGYGRVLAVCRVAGIDLGHLLVKEGLAWAFRKYSTDYIDAEDQARTVGVGIWAGSAEPAWEYRANRWSVAVQDSPAGCPIKGNINKKGERIYHAPWSPWYSRTSVKLKAGERWFCDEGEAVAAGWRAPFWGRRSGDAD